jgi:hypothetical protein
MIGIVEFRNCEIVGLGRAPATGAGVDESDPIRQFENPAI